MKIDIAMVQVPFIRGGAEILADMLCNELKNRGHQADIITIPFKWYPSTSILNCMLAGRMLDLSEINGEKIDMVIAMKFPAYYVKHNNKVLWLMHQHRQAYDLWESPYGDMDKWPDGEFVREMINEHDNKYISEAKAIFTISQNTTNRLLHFNKIDSEILYHPPLNYEKMYCESYGDYIFYPSRIDPMKRQRLLVEAARYIQTEAKIIIAGTGSKSELLYINDYIKKYKLENKISLTGFISEEEKIRYYGNCLAVYFGAYDEDYGYITLEGFFSKKPVIVHTDAGGPLEFVKNNENGYVLENNARLLANKIDELYLNKIKAKEMGENGYRLIQEKNINWDYVIDKLLQ